MNNLIEKEGFSRQIAASGRIVLATMTICCILYSLIILVFGQVLVPYSANGSIMRNEREEIVGSEVLAQGFSRPEYFWPRPSAVDYNASAAGGSNLSPANPALRARAENILARMEHAGGRPIPADLVTTSGSGMDPHITLRAAEFQVERVAAARGLSVAAVRDILENHAKRPGGSLTPEPLVNVLDVNRALDKTGK